MSTKPIRPDGAPVAPQPRLASSDGKSHAVEFYKKDDALLDQLSRFIGAALGSGDAAIVIATPQHREGLNRRLQSQGLDVLRASAHGRYMPLDADETLSRVAPGHLPDWEIFAEFVGGLILKARAATGRKDAAVAIFGEMVARLWAEGKGDAVLTLEQFWNKLGRIQSFSLRCAYPVHAFYREDHGDMFLKICAEHSSVIPTEDYALASTDEERLRDIAYLQQRSQALEAALALRQIEERFRLFVEAVQDYAIIMLDAEGHVSSWNAGAQRIKGYEASEIIGRHFSRFYPQEDARRGKPGRLLQIAADEGRVEDEGWRVRKDGSKFWADVIITAVRDDAGKLVGFGKVVRDRTEQMLARKQLEEAQEKLRKSERSLRDLSLHLLRSQDEERRRIGREMHDSLGQYLSVLKMKLDSIGFLPESHCDDVVKKQILECSNFADECVKEVRTISYLLYPPLLEEMGLRSAIPWYLSGFSKRSGIKTDFQAPEDFGRMPQDAELVLFRVLQECLTNVHRHSESPTAEIRLDRTPEAVVMTVTDHGKGMPPPLLEQYKRDWMGALGVGLRGMNERLQQLGGRLDITSGAHGTEVRATVPAEPQSSNEDPSPELSEEEAGEVRENPSHESKDPDRG